MNLVADDGDETWPTDAGPVLPDGVTMPGRPVRVVDWAARSDVGLVRQRNEDRWSHQAERLFVVADGMGGHDGGELAAETVVELVAAHDGSLWHDHLARVNERVRTRTAEAGFSEAGTTLVAVAIDGPRATVVGTGDSRVYRLREGRLDQLTEDHTVRGDLLAAGIDADQHASPKQARGLTSYLGIGPDRLRVDVIDVPIRSGDRLLLCSDGIHHAIDHVTLADRLGRDRAHDAVDDLIGLARTNGGRDNATAIVIDLG